MSGNSGHILIVEDDPIHNKVVALHLSRAGFDVAAAYDCARALSLAEHEHFDLVVADYHLPDFPGTELIKWLRKKKSYAATPIILVTAFAEDLNEERLRDELCVLLLSKPCNMARLVEIVRELLDRAPGKAKATAEPVAE